MGIRWKSTASRYGSVAIAIHWLSALLIVALLTSGFLAANAADVKAKADVLSIHGPLGISPSMWIG